MSRPKKTGLDYFPFDVDYWDDFKIMDLLNEYGPLGTAIYEIILSKVYRNGYYLEVPLDKLATQIVRIIGNRWIKEKNLVLQVIQYCADIGLFNNALLMQSVITSVGIQRRYSEVTVRNKVDKSKYWLLDKEENQAALINIPQNTVSVTKTGISVAETKINATVIPQKERKGKERKGKEMKGEKLRLPSSDGSYILTEEFYNKLVAAYPQTDVDECLRNINIWFESNRNQLKPSKEMTSYINTWIARDTERGKCKKVDNFEATYDLEEYENSSIFDE